MATTWEIEEIAPAEEPPADALAGDHDAGEPTPEDAVAIVADVALPSATGGEQ